jgi:two-component system, chemotaxis family, sensor kinase CheA
LIGNRSINTGKEDKVSEDRKSLAEKVEQLAIQTMLVDPDDLGTLGALLEQLEAIEQANLEKGLESVPVLCRTLRSLLEKIILNEMEAPSKGIDLLGEGVKLLQAKVSLPDALQTLPEDHFWKETAALLGKEAPLPDGKGTRNEKEVPSLKESMDLGQDRSLLKDFVSEAMEHLQSIELNIINLEQSPDNKECINSIFRPFHTIKGVSGFLNLKEINRFSHAVESLLDQARNSKIRIHQGMIDFILEAVDLLKNMIQDLKAQLDSGTSGSSHFDLEPYLKQIALLEKGGGESPDPGIISPIEPEIKVPFLGEILSAKGIVSKEEVSAALKEQIASKGELKLGEILVSENKAKPRQVVEALREQKQISAQQSDETVKVDTKKLDNLVDMVGELVIAESLVHQNPVLSSLQDQKLARDFSQLKRITAELQKISMSLRMVPVRQTFQKMIRLVRDLGKKSDKLVELVMSGEETEIDRNMVDSFYEPLVHMVRNAIDHGIEPPAKRRETGKPKMGKISLKAYQKGGNVIIEIEDDGQGLNREKILKRATEKGLVSADQSLTDHEIHNLIFLPGFSTAEKVTDVSGRGVGMDVVKRAIEKLKGKVEIFSTEGKGSRFLIRAPLTLAIMDGIVVRIGEERYIIPTVFVKETLRPSRGDIQTVQQKGEVVQVRKSLLPLVRLYNLLHVEPQKRDPSDALVIVAENEGFQRCLMVDDLLGKQEVVVKNLGERFKNVKGVAGATIMGDGRVGLIMDIHGIFQIDQMAPSLRS